MNTHHTHMAFLSCVALFTMLMLTSCHKRLQPTAIQVEDSLRQYPTIVLGEDLTLTYKVRNIGSEVLQITDVQPSCPVIEPSPNNINSIPPGEEATMKFIFHSGKGIGLARHSIRLFGNIFPKGVAELIFETHVVRPSIDWSDYEEYYQKNIESSEEDLLDGKNSERGYTPLDKATEFNTIN